MKFYKKILISLKIKLTFNYYLIWKFFHKKTGKKQFIESNIPIIGNLTGIQVVKDTDLPEKTMIMINKNIF